MVLPHALRELFLLSLGFSQWFFFLCSGVSSFKSWFLSCSSSYSSGVSPSMSWFLLMVLPHVLREFLLLSPGSSPWFFLMFFWSFAFYASVIADINLSPQLCS